MVPDGKRMKFSGGYGVTVDNLRQPVSSVSSAPWPELLATRDVGIGAEIVMKGDVEAVWLVPLYVEGMLRAVWCIPYPARDSPPAAHVITELVRWLSPRLLLESAAKGGRARAAGREIDGPSGEALAVDAVGVGGEALADDVDVAVAAEVARQLHSITAASS